MKGQRISGRLTEVVYGTHGGIKVESYRMMV